MAQPNTPTKLNHMSFPTPDVSATSAFFETYLGFTLSFETPNFSILKRPGLDVVIERAASDAATIKAVGSRSQSWTTTVDHDAEQITWPIAFHVGLELPTLADVEALHDRLAADGFQSETGIFNHERGSRFFLRAPGGVLFEFNTRSDASEEFRGTFDD